MLSSANLKAINPHDKTKYWKTISLSYYKNRDIITNIDIPEKQEYTFARKVRIYPSTKQKELFNQFLGANRYFYNKTNHYIKNNESDAKRFNHFYMRKKMFENPKSWYDDIPYDSKSLAIKQCITAYKSALSNLKNGNIESFDIGYLRKKGTSQVFFVDTRAFDFESKSIFPRRLKRNKILRIKEDIEATGCSNVILLKVKPGRWFLCVPYCKKVKDQPIYNAPPYKNVFLDPGGRTFQTCYNSDTQTFTKLGDGFIDDKLMQLALKVDKLISIKSKAKGRTKYNLSKRCAKIRYHMKNMITNLHYQSINYLTKNFQNIFLPYFDTNRISNHIERNINNKAVRKIMMLSHGMFRERLEHAVKTKQRNLFYVPEAYTTKTCPACGKQNDIGASKVHSCSCGYKGDRDETAALNIFISTLTRTNN